MGAGIGTYAHVAAIVAQLADVLVAELRVVLKGDEW